MCNFFFCQFYSQCVCWHEDFRVNYCYTKFENGRCQAPKPQNTTKEVCCCTGMPGQGWGDPCEICPSKGEGEYTTCLNDLHTRGKKLIACVSDNDICHIWCSQRHILSSAAMWDISRGKMTTLKVCVSSTLHLHRNVTVLIRILSFPCFFFYCRCWWVPQ